jgi:hypothetical protein
VRTYAEHILSVLRTEGIEPVRVAPRSVHDRQAPTPSGELLTEREVEVLRLLAAGCSNQAIAQEPILAGTGQAPSQQYLRQARRPNPPRSGGAPAISASSKLPRQPIPGQESTPNTSFDTCVPAGLRAILRSHLNEGPKA